MSNSSYLIRAYRLERLARNFGTSLLAGTFVAVQATPALAFIDNTANAVGTPPSGAPTNYPAAPLVQVPVAASAPAMTVTKAATVPTVAAGADPAITDALDTITYTYTVSNTGNVTMTGVQPTDTGPTFNGTVHDNALGAYTILSFTGAGAVAGTSNGTGATANLPPGTSAQFQAIYTLSALDVYRAAGITQGVVNTTSASGTPPTGPAYTIPPAGQPTVKTTIAAGAKLATTKVAVLTTDTNANGKADLNDVVTYTYTVTNTGNVPMTAVSIKDMHGSPATQVTLGSTPYGADPAGIRGETLTTAGPMGAAASTNGTANDGIWNTLAPGATVTFTFVHTVTQAEVDHG